MPITISNEENCEEISPCDKLTLVSKNIIEEYQFKIETRINNSMNGQ